MTTASEPVAALVEGHHQRYLPEYRGGLSDHGPMAVLAMHGLGLPAERIDEFYRRYVTRLEPAESRAPPALAEYRGAVGQRSAYPALLGFFADQIARHGVDATLARHLPDLLPGWANAAFHPFIRLGYGLEFGVAGEVAAGLAYAACLGPHPDIAVRAAECLSEAPADPNDTAAALRARLLKLAPEQLPRDDGLFQPRLTRALRSELLEGIGPPRGGLEALAATCREVFAATHNFFALHLVTGTHALRVCLAHLEPTPPAADALAVCGVMAAYLAVGAPPFSSSAARERDEPGFDSHPYLCRASDEHDIKLAYSTTAQAAAYDDPAYLAAARGYLARRSP